MLDPNQFQTLSRRQLFQSSATGVAGIALSSLLHSDSEAAGNDSDPVAAKPPHFVPRAKNVIFIHMVGAPSHLDLFASKNALQKNDGKPCPKEFIEGKRFAFLRGHPKLRGTKFKFAQHGESGMELSSLLPNISRHVDNIAMLKAIRTDQFNHGPAQLFLQTGFSRFGRPSMGSWVSYGLGSENRDLPSFVVLITGSVAGAGNSLWGSGFLPTVYQGIEFRSKGDPVLFLSNPEGLDPSARKSIVGSINALNKQQLTDVGDPEIATRINQYEMAFRMQSSVPELMDIAQETPETHAAYGTKPGQASFANNCLLARRLVERGVRFVQLFDQGWDHHGGLDKSLPNKCKQVDKPIAALLEDLKQRGMLEDTLVVWGAEFGRTPMLQNDRVSGGRDHHKEAFCMWMAGGGVRGGVSYGKTDDLGYFPVVETVHVHDVQATILHLLGLDHERLTYKYQGRQFRLTDVHGNVIRPILA